MGQDALLSGKSGVIGLSAVEPSSEMVLKELASASIEGSTSRSATVLAIPAKSLPRVAGNSLLQFRPHVTGLKIGPETILSLGHIYRKPEREGVAKGGPTTDDGEEIPHRFLLHPNYPNPFNPTTNFTFDIAEPGEVSLTVHDLLGREVDRVAEGHREPGRYTVEWNASSNRKAISSGVYLARLQVKNAMGTIFYSQTSKIIVVK